MEAHFTPDATMRPLQGASVFSAFVRTGLAQVVRGAFIEEEGTDARFKRMFRGWNAHLFDDGVA
jgi:hypothetical protein